MISYDVRLPGDGFEPIFLFAGGHRNNVIPSRMILPENEQRWIDFPFFLDSTSEFRW